MHDKDAGKLRQAVLDSLIEIVCTEGALLTRVMPRSVSRLCTDWSEIGLGEVMGQADENGREQLENL